MTAQFDDGKDDGALRTIGEVGQALGLKPHVLRYWEEQFPTLRPLKRSGNRRYYRSADIALVETIDRLVNVEGYTIKGARTAIEQGRMAVGEPDGDAVPVEDALPEAIAERGVPEQAVAEPDPSAGNPSERGPSAGAGVRAPNSASASVEGKGVPVELVAQLREIRMRLAAAIAD